MSVPREQQRAGDGVPTIDPDVARARTLPGRVHVDAGFFARTVEGVLRHAWTLVDAGATPRGPRAAAPVTLFEGALDEPAALVADADGTERLLSNVCTHRANLVVRDAGPCRELRCGYHGRRFELNGRLRASPGFEGAADFPAAWEHLRALGLGRLGPLAYGAFEPTLAFEEWAAPTGGRLGHLPWDALRPLPERDRDFELRASWILYVENYLEGFHVPFVHPGLSAALDVSRYTHELLPWGTLQVAEARAGEPALPPSPADGGRRVAAHYLWLFPTTMLNVYPWGVSVNAVEPLAVDRTRVRFRSLVWDEAQLDRGAGADLWQVELEDEAVVEACQRGNASRAYDRGRYAPRHELGTHRFHRLLTAVLGGGWADARRV